MISVLYLPLLCVQSYKQYAINIQADQLENVFMFEKMQTPKYDQRNCTK